MLPLKARAPTLQSGKIFDREPALLEILVDDEECLGQCSGFGNARRPSLLQRHAVLLRLVEIPDDWETDSLVMDQQMLLDLGPIAHLGVTEMLIWHVCNNWWKQLLEGFWCSHAFLWHFEILPTAVHACAHQVVPLPQRWHAEIIAIQNGCFHLVKPFGVPLGVGDASEPVDDVLLQEIFVRLGLDVGHLLEDENLGLATADELYRCTSGFAPLVQLALIVAHSAERLALATSNVDVDFAVGA